MTLNNEEEPQMSEERTVRSTEDVRAELKNGMRDHARIMIQNLVGKMWNEIERGNKGEIVNAALLALESAIFGVLGEKLPIHRKQIKLKAGMGVYGLFAGMARTGIADIRHEVAGKHRKGFTAGALQTIASEVISEEYMILRGEAPARILDRCERPKWRRKET